MTDRRLIVRPHVDDGDLSTSATLVAIAHPGRRIEPDEALWCARSPMSWRLPEASDIRRVMAIASSPNFKLAIEKEKALTRASIAK